MSTRIGVDLGGTKIEAIAMDASGAILARQRVATPKGDYQATFQAIVALVNTLRQGDGCASIGIATPGVHCRVTERMKNCNSTCLNGQPLLQDLAAQWAEPVHMANDANCFALSEAVDGAAAGASSVFGVILGTGVGGGVVIDQQVLDGAHGLAGEWGHNPLPMLGERPSRPCYCGRSDCIETWLSGPGLERSYRDASGQALSAQEIAARDEAGDALATAVMQQYCADLAYALATVVNVVDPDTIVLGGGLSNIARLYQDLPVLLEQAAFGPNYQARIVAPQYGDASGVRGAAWLGRP